MITQNSDMQWYLILVLIMIILLFISFLPLFMSCRIYFNAKQNLGVILISLWGIPISCFQIEIKKTAITIIKRKKEKQIQLKIIDEKAIFMQNFITCVFRYIKINEISIFVEAGKVNDACFTSLLNGTILNFIFCLYGMLYTLKRDFKAYISADSNTASNELKFATYCSVVVTPIMFIVSYIRAKLRTKRTVKVYENFGRRQNR